MNRTTAVLRRARNLCVAAAQFTPFRPSLPRALPKHGSASTSYRPFSASPSKAPISDPADNSLETRRSDPTSTWHRVGLTALL
jgi:hypothetical protein